MSLFWNRKRHIKEDKTFDIASSDKVEVLKIAAHKTADEASRKIDRLNRLLAANGITLKIYIATGGDRRGHK